MNADLYYDHLVRDDNLRAALHEPEDDMNAVHFDTPYFGPNADRWDAQAVKDFLSDCGESLGMEDGSGLVSASRAAECVEVLAFQRERLVLAAEAVIRELEVSRTAVSDDALNALQVWCSRARWGTVR